MDVMIWDILAFAWLVIFLALGMNRGLILTLGTLCVTALAFVGAYWLELLLGPELATILSENTEGIAQFFSSAIANGVVFFAGYLVFRGIGSVALSALNLVGKIPGLHFLNRLGGGILGLFRGALLLLILGQLLVLAGVTPVGDALCGTILAKYFFIGFL